MKPTSLTLTLLLLQGGLACGVDLKTPEGARIWCSFDDAECPSDQICDARAHRCVAHGGVGDLRLISAVSTSERSVALVFTKPVDPMVAADPSHYATTPALDMSGVDQSGEPGTLTVRTSTQQARVYELTVEHLLDIDGLEIAPAAATASFLGKGASVDDTAPDILDPADHARLPATTSQAHLRWSSRMGATDYTVEVALDPGMSEAYPGSPFTFDADTTETSLAVVADQAYFWRVHTDLSTPAVFAGASFAVVDSGALYVYCPAGVDCQTPPTAPLWEAGVRDLPFLSVGRALAVAGLVGANRIAIAARGDGSAYPGHVASADGGIDWYGGYDPGFTTRDPQANPTLLSAVTLVNVARPTVIDGLTFRDSPFALQVSASTDALTLQNDIFETPGDSTALGALVIDGATDDLAGPTVKDCIVRQYGGSNGAYVLQVRGAPALLQRVTLESVSPTGGTPPRPSAWMRIAGSAHATIEDSHIGNVPAWPSGIFVDAGNATLRHNTITGGDYGIEISSDGINRCPNVLLDGNSVSTAAIGSEVLAVAQINYQCGVVDLRNNLLFAGPTTNLSGATTVGLACRSLSGMAGSRTYLLNNTIVVAPGLPQAAALSGTDCNLIAANNTFLCLGTSVTDIGIENASTLQVRPYSLENNFVTGCPTLYHDESHTFTAATDLNGLDDPSVTATGTRIDGNFTLAATWAQIFVDAAGLSAAVPSLANADLHLRTPAPADPEYADVQALATGGKDTGGNDCGRHQAPESCGAVSTDADGKPRTAPPSVGAFERE